jgi:hypothetical protein
VASIAGSTKDGADVADIAISTELQLQRERNFKRSAALRRDTKQASSESCELGKINGRTKKTLSKGPRGGLQWGWVRRLPSGRLGFNLGRRNDLLGVK